MQGSITNELTALERRYWDAIQRKDEQSAMKLSDARSCG